LRSRTKIEEERRAIAAMVNQPRHHESFFAATIGKTTSVCSFPFGDARSRSWRRIIRVSYLELKASFVMSERISEFEKIIPNIPTKPTIMLAKAKNRSGIFLIFLFLIFTTF